MTTLGKSLVFYFKYNNEVCELYEDRDDDDDLPIIPDHDEKRTRDLIKRIEAISDQADDEFEIFRERIDASFEKVLGDSFNIKKIARKSWASEYGVWPKQIREIPSKYIITIGVTVDANKKQIQFWIWGKGGKNANKVLSDIFKGTLTRAPIEWQSGISIFKTVDVPISANSLEVEMEPILKEVNDALVDLSKEKVLMAFDALSK